MIEGKHVPKGMWVEQNQNTFALATPIVQVSVTTALTPPQ